MTLNEAARNGIARVRKEVWISPTGYLKIDLFPEGNGYGPWAHLYDRGVQEVLGESTPQDILSFQIMDTDFVPYYGELDAGDV